MTFLKIQPFFISSYLPTSSDKAVFVKESHDLTGIHFQSCGLNGRYVRVSDASRRSYVFGSRHYTENVWLLTEGCYVMVYCFDKKGLGNASLSIA